MVVAITENQYIRIPGLAPTAAAQQRPEHGRRQPRGPIAELLHRRSHAMAPRPSGVFVVGHDARQCLLSCHHVLLLRLGNTPVSILRSSQGKDGATRCPIFLTRDARQAAFLLVLGVGSAERKSAGAPGVLEAPVSFGGPSGTRTPDPLIKRRGPAASRSSVFLHGSMEPRALARVLIVRLED